MIIIDFEVFKYDWLVCWLDTTTKKLYNIVNDTDSFAKLYEHYKDTVWIGYNIRGYDKYVAQGLLCDFDPFEISKFIIEDGKKGFEFSRLLSKFPINVYDTAPPFKSLKELEAYMGHDIRETTVPFDLNRKLTKQEIEETIKYCEHDVKETAEVFLERIAEYDSHVGLMEEFGLTLDYIGKTKAQIAAVILEAVPEKRKDEFDISFPDTLQLGKYEYVKNWYINWKNNSRDYSEKLVTDVCGVPHTFAFGGLHGSRNNYYGTGTFLMADVGSYYPALMIEYGYLSRNVRKPEKYKQIRDERIVMKKAKDPREYPRKIVLNSSFGAEKDKFNRLYDPRNANNICIAGQLLLTDLLDKLEGKAQLIQSNTDGILFKLYNDEDWDMIVEICEEWSKRTRMTLDYDKYTKVIQKDVNNYILVDEKGKVKSKGSYVKKLSKIDNDLPIVNRAVRDYFVSGKSVRTTVYESDSLIDFQKISKIGGMYEYVFKEVAHGPCKEFLRFKPRQRVKNGQVVERWVESVIERRFGNVLHTKVNRVFASKSPIDGMLMKKKADKSSLDKIGGTPEQCFIINSDINDMTIPEKLDREWYVTLANERIQDFLGR